MLHDEYELRRVDGEIIVFQGKFSAPLDELNRTGELVSKAGRRRLVPAWEVQAITRAAQTAEV